MWQFWGLHVFLRIYVYPLRKPHESCSISSVIYITRQHSIADSPPRPGWVCRRDFQVHHLLPHPVVLLLSAVGVPGCPCLTHDFPTCKRDHLIILSMSSGPHILLGCGSKPSQWFSHFNFKRAKRTTWTNRWDRTWIWVNYNNSLTWIKAIWGRFP